tara:strand:+ start:836 stop:1006 length:171 start_codon:yes stop_codon:yes gene_type:complete
MTKTIGYALFTNPFKYGETCTQTVSLIAISAICSKYREAYKKYVPNPLSAVKVFLA